MVSLAEVKNGLTQYLDSELISGMTGWRKWTVGAGIALYLENISNTFNKLKTNTFIQSLGVIDENDQIDIDKLHRVFSEQAQKGAITFDTPMLGTITLNANDVDKLYSYIKGGA